MICGLSVGAAGGGDILRHPAFNEEVLPHGFGKTEAVTPQQLLYLIAVTQVHGPPSLRMVAHNMLV